MSNPVRVGFVGARFAARFHWEAIRRVYGVPVEVVGVTSKTAEARDAFARDTKSRAFATFTELCAAVDVVDLCTPPSSHEELAVQALGLAFALSTFGEATKMNIAYNSRGLWSVVLIWAFGHWFGNTEREGGTRRMLRRLAGATLLVAAILIASR